MCRICFGSTLYPIIIVADLPCYRLQSPHGIAGMYTAWQGTAVAQAPIYGLDPSRYSEPEQTWGGTPVVVVAGDELQLPPVPFEASLLAPVEGSSHEQKVGILSMARCGEASQNAKTPHGNLSGYRCSQTGAYDWLSEYKEYKKLYEFAWWERKPIDEIKSMLWEIPLSPDTYDEIVTSIEALKRQQQYSRVTLMSSTDEYSSSKAVKRRQQ